MAEMKLHESAFDPLDELEPQILSAQFMVSDVYGGGFGKEDRRLIKQLVP
jgi:acetoacetate decarboxylase